MSRNPRWMSASERNELWRRWRDGDSLKEIARALGRAHPSVWAIVSGNGGISPEPRRRSDRVLSLSDREEISRGLSAQLSLREIARELGRAPSTVSREVARNGGPASYRASRADAAAWQRARRPKTAKLATNVSLQQLVAEKLGEDWSPEQISGWLRREHRDEPDMQVSHETIYKTLFVQARGVLKKELLGHLRTHRHYRRSIHSTTEGQCRGQIIGGISIRERPPEVEDRALPGHWEGDLLAGSKNTHIATLVERQSRYTMLVKVDGKDTANVVSALIRQVRKLPVELRKSLTWDRGMEMALHRQFSLATNFKVYFCDPQSPWQRGTNENTNRLLRQYFPKKTSLDGFSQQELDAVALRLNQRPRKTLAFDTPAAKLESIVATTG
ncbi:MAG TPA: IS30 family transposase [Thermoanaerobaculia bacterium]|nr:IS30 family transposase [Thermoanaerobaculia bacterium]